MSFIQLRCHRFWSVIHICGLIDSPSCRVIHTNKRHRQEKLQDGAEETKRLQEAKARLQQRSVELAAELADEKVRDGRRTIGKGCTN